MKKLTNDHGIDLPLAVWLLQNGYNSGADVAPKGELLSVTSLMKPTRRLILERQVDQEQETMDVSDMIPSRMGHGLHDSIERAWTEGDWAGAMRRLHYPQSVVDRVKINPDPSKVGVRMISQFTLKSVGLRKLAESSLPANWISLSTVLTGTLNRLQPSVIHPGLKIRIIFYKGRCIV